MSPLEQGKYASYLYYHGLLDSEQFFILRDLEDTLIDMVSPYLAILVLKVLWHFSLQYIKLLYNCRFRACLKRRHVYQAERPSGRVAEINFGLMSTNVYQWPSGRN